MFNGTSTLDRSICANCGRVKPTQLAKDGQRDIMHNSQFVTQWNTVHNKNSNYKNATTGYLDWECNIALSGGKYSSEIVNERNLILQNPVKSSFVNFIVSFGTVDLLNASFHELTVEKTASDVINSLMYLRELIPTSSKMVYLIPAPCGDVAHEFYSKFQSCVKIHS